MLLPQRKVKGGNMCGRRFGLAIAAVALVSSMPAAQNNSQPIEVINLQPGHSFHGDLRNLPHGLPKQREKAQKGEEPSIQANHNSGDPVAQTAPGNAPTPPPGSGGNAGNFSG